MNRLSIRQMAKYIFSNFFLIVNVKISKKLIFYIKENIQTISLALNLVTDLFA